MSSSPTVYFIDDSATMREVIKIAFRRENINVVTCNDAVTALAEIEKARPDIVISDVIMPSKDGYEVCQFIKSHPELSRTPVVLMSGIVNRAVAERAFAVKADELLRKPFQPQDLIARVRHLLSSTGIAPVPPPAINQAAMALSSIFSATPPQGRQPAPGPFGPQPVPMPRPMPAVASMGAPAVVTPQAQPAGPVPVPAAAVREHAANVALSNGHTTNGNGSNGQSAQAAPLPTPVAATAAHKPLTTVDASRLKIEILRLEGLVKKLQSELEAERQYSRALEEHVKTLQEAE